MGFFSQNISVNIKRGIKAVIQTGALYGVYATITNEFIDFYCVKDVSMQPTLSGEYSDRQACWTPHLQPPGQLWDHQSPLDPL